MKFTNNLDLPQPIVDAILNDDYDKGDSDFSITELLGPARIAKLTRLHWDELEEDLSDRIWSLVGRVVHGIFEKAERSAFSEKRLFMDLNGFRISGQVDRFDLHQGELIDYKFVTYYKVKNNCLPEEYIQQLNCYAELVRANKAPITKLSLVAILRDWSKGKAKRELGVPNKQVVKLEAPLWDSDRTRRFLSGRLFEHTQEQLPLCTNEERWKTNDKWAVIKRGNKRAKKLLPSLEQATWYLEECGRGFEIEQRYGEAKRCKDYCIVSKHCKQWRDENEIHRE